MLMATTSYKESEAISDTWYLDTGCLSHITSKKEWLSEFDDSKKTNMRLADSRSMKVQGMGNVTVQGKDGKKAVIEKVLYVPEMKCNLMSVGQLIEKGYSVTMENDTLKLYNSEKKLILQSNLTKNKTFKTSIVIKEEMSYKFQLKMINLNFGTKGMDT